MEPMNLGSPGGSPATSNSSYLPAFLMGDQTPTTPRNNILSPNKSGRNVSFATSPGNNSPQDYNRAHKTLFSTQPATPSGAGGVSTVSNFAGTPMQNHNASLSGPPTQGLFDSLRCEQNQVQTPTKSIQPQGHFGTPLAIGLNNTGTGMNQSYHQHTFQAQQYNDSYLNNGSFNASRAVLSPLAPSTPTISMAQNSQILSTPRYSEFWVTVFGFPNSATTTILQHFAQCGTIIDKIFPPQNGNWVHIKYSSRLEADKALNYNEKILSNNIMIGVTQCKDKTIVDKENLCESKLATTKIRPLAHTAYKNAQNESAVVAGPNAPQKSTGLMSKAIDLFFGW